MADEGFKLINLQTAPADREAIEIIQKECSQPGAPINRSAAIRIALRRYAAQLTSARQDEDGVCHAP